MLQVKRIRPKELERIHARYRRAYQRPLDFRVWVAAGWGIVVGTVLMWLFTRLAG